MRLSTVHTLDVATPPFAVSSERATPHHDTLGLVSTTRTRTVTDGTDRADNHRNGKINSNSEINSNGKINSFRRGSGGSTARIRG